MQQLVLQKYLTAPILDEYLHANYQDYNDSLQQQNQT